MIDELEKYIKIKNGKEILKDSINIKTKLINLLTLNKN